MRRRWMGVGALALAAGLLVGGTPAGALTLEDLAEGGSFTAGNGVTYGGFDVKVKGKAGKDLSAFVVDVDEDGFSVSRSGEPRKKGGGKSKVVLSYTASADAGLVAAALSVDGVSAKKQLFVQGMKLGQLVANPKGSSAGPFDISGLDALDLRDSFRLGAGSSVATQITAVPEPSTLALALGGVGALAALRRRSRADAAV